MPKEMSEPSAEQVWPTAIAGFRVWYAYPDGRLDALYTQDEWVGPDQPAQCDRAAHSAPAADCECGWHAWFGLTQPLRILSSIKGRPTEDGRGYILGAIAGAGRVRIHPDRFRAERAQILGVWEVCYDREGAPAGRELAAQVAARHHTLSYATPSALAARVSELGLWTPPEPRPQARTRALLSRLRRWA